ncbi:MAG: hypothetical protein R3B57_07970 [Phycisphaerales bacterium]
MKRTRLVLVVFAFLAGSMRAMVAGAAPSDVFDVEGQAAERGWVTFGEEAPDAARMGSAMLRRLDGVAGVLDAKDVRELRRSARKVWRADDQGDAGERRWVVHLENDSGRTRVEILRVGDAWVARSMEDPSVAAELHERWFAPLAAGWAPAHIEGSEALPLGQVVDLPHPYVEGQVVLTDLVMRDRFGAGRGGAAEALSGVTRVLAEEKMWVRLPKGYDPNVASGVVVWCSPTDEWRIPKEFFDVLDELNLIACGFDNAGNYRKTRDGSTHGIVDRLQLMLDAAQTCRSRFNVDETRVYMTGFSGGGRVSSIMVLAFPEIFRGAVPIVGLDSYKPAQVGGGKYVPARLPKPKGELWKLVKERRMWALTGSEDFNRVEIEARVAGLVEDGLPVRLHTTPGMVHTDMPAEATVAEALRWVDEPWREARAMGVEQGETMWKAYVESHGEVAPGDEGAARELVGVTDAAPWSEVAWKAAGLLGYQRE